MAVFQEQDSGGCRLVVRPNCALTWRSTKYLIWFFAACFAAVGAYFASLGAWLVLPFAGLELIVLVAGFYLSALSGHSREVIEVNGPDLRVLRGRSRLVEVARFPAHWTRVLLRRDPRGWYPSRLLLACHGKGLEIGCKLVEAEREDLASNLEDLLSFRQSGTGRLSLAPHSAGLALPAQSGQGVRAVLDADARAITGTSLAPKGARATGCAIGAFTEKREDPWQ